MIGNLIVKTKIKFPIMINIEYLGAFLLIVFCNFWVYKARPFIPLYYFYLVSLLLLFLSIFIKQKINLLKCEVLSLVCSLYTFLTLLITNTEWQYTVHMATAISCFVITTILCRFLNKKQVLSITNFMLLLNFLYIATETYWRITHPMLGRDRDIISENTTFYIFKTNSFIISDSNSIGLMTIIFIFLSVYLYNYVSKNKIYIFYIIAFTILTILSFSRAAWIAVFFTGLIIFSIDFLKKHLFIYLKQNKITIKFLMFILIVPVFTIFLLITIFCLLLQDGSFLTKIDLARNIFDFFLKSSIYQIIFGIGSSLDASDKIYQRYPHNIILTYLTWVGLLGTSVVYYFWLCIYKITNKRSWLIFIPQIFAGISYTMPGLHLFYVSLAIITYFEYILPKQKRRFNAASINNSSNL